MHSRQRLRGPLVAAVLVASSQLVGDGARAAGPNATWTVSAGGLVDGNVSWRFFDGDFTYGDAPTPRRLVLDILDMKKPHEVRCHFDTLNELGIEVAEFARYEGADFRATGLQMHLSKVDDHFEFFVLPKPHGDYRYVMTVNAQYSIAFIQPYSCTVKELS